MHERFWNETQVQDCSMIHGLGNSKSTTMVTKGGNIDHWHKIITKALQVQTFGYFWPNLLWISGFWGDTGPLVHLIKYPFSTSKRYWEPNWSRILKELINYEQVHETLPPYPMDLDWFFARTQENTMTSFSWPWNPSTVLISMSLTPLSKEILKA